MPLLNGTFDIQAAQGKTFVLSSTYENDDGTFVNLTGYTGRMQVRASPDSADVLLELTTANGRFLFPDPVNGQVRFQVTAADMAAIAPGHYVYDSELVNGSTVEPHLSGAFIVEAETTR